MKEKLFGALLALSPFKGNAQEAKAIEKDKTEPKIEQVTEKPVDKLLKDKKTANPWHLTLESNVSLINKPAEIIKGENKLKSVEDFESAEKTEKEMLLSSAEAYDNSVSKNTLYKEVDKIAETDGLKDMTKLWADYKAGKISAAEAAQQLRFTKPPFPFDPKIILLDKNLSPLIEKSGETISNEASLLLSNYFSEAEILKNLKIAKIILIKAQC